MTSFLEISTSCILVRDEWKNLVLPLVGEGDIRVELLARLVEFHICIQSFNLSILHWELCGEHVICSVGG